MFFGSLVTIITNPQDHVACLFLIFCIHFIALSIILQSLSLCIFTNISWSTINFKTQNASRLITEYYACGPPQDFSHFGDDMRTTRSHDTLSVLKTVICVYFSSKTKHTVLTCWFVFFFLPDTKKLCIVDTVA